jgi:hypothetical protein
MKTQEIEQGIADLLAKAGIEPNLQEIQYRLMAVGMSLNELHAAACATEGQDGIEARIIRTEWRIRALWQIRECHNLTDLTAIIRISPNNDDEVRRCFIMKASTLITSASSFYAGCGSTEPAINDSHDECTADSDDQLKHGQGQQTDTTNWKKRLGAVGATIGHRRKNEEGTKTGLPKKYVVGEPGIPDRSTRISSPVSWINP